MPFIISDAEGKWGRVGNGLNTLNRFIKKFIQAELITYFSSLPRYTYFRIRYKNLCTLQGYSEKMSTVISF